MNRAFSENTIVTHLQTGYEYHWLEQKSQRADPLVVTLFSAPNYLDLFKVRTR
jgi:hypothetical protein